MLNHVGAFWWLHSCRILSLPFCFTCLCSPHVIMNGDSIYTTTASNSWQWPIFRWWSNGYFPIVPEVGTQPNHWPVRMYVTHMTEGSLEVKLPTIWTDEKTEVERVREENQKEKEDQRRERRRHKMQAREKVAKSQNTVFFQWFVEGRKVGSLKRRVRSRLGGWEIKKWTPLWREAHFQVKM